MWTFLKGFCILRSVTRIMVQTYNIAAVTAASPPIPLTPTPPPPSASFTLIDALLAASNGYFNLTCRYRSANYNSGLLSLVIVFL